MRHLRFDEWIKMHSIEIQIFCPFGRLKFGNYIWIKKYQFYATQPTNSFIFFIPNNLFLKKFQSHISPHFFAQVMASCVRGSCTEEEDALLAAAFHGNFDSLSALLRKGVYPSVYDDSVWKKEKMEEKMEDGEEREKVEEMRNRERMAHFLISSFM